ncbi:PepSY domain-containing protein [Pseudoblastomonas halimionae]|uniref:PepSY domain-containing protein n=1 Tax=Alteriqipengyuania halimionae TaxID=1926630 RepID=A0A6I4U3T4_9SPHN|nr:PepSY domain-containing protein [Alteriqipengyuania halimionae]MXP09132.1 hypothetical protein [Alteriqipengyuania halimionae]
MFRILALSFSLTLALPSAAQAQTRDEQAEARKEMRAGNLLTLEEIHRRVVPQFERKGMEYIAVELDPRARVYRFKFLDDRQVVWVDVDARSGRILRIRR